MELLTVTRTSPLNAALKDGRVRPEGFAFRFEEVQPVTKAFRIMSRELAYDVTEMAATTYLVARDHGKPFTALPVFLTRGLHRAAVVAREPGDPRALAGRRVGVNRGYTVTTGVWARGILAADHGLDLDSVTWVCTDEEHVTEFERPANVELAPGLDLAGAVLSGELAAAVGQVRGADDLVPLVEGARERDLELVSERGWWPVNHLLVVRDDRLDLAPAIFAAFERAKDLYVESGELEPEHAEIRDRLGGDPLPYGVEPNRAALEQLIDYAVAQRILRRRPSVDELFAPTQ